MNNLTDIECQTMENLCISKEEREVEKGRVRVCRKGVIAQ